jgi:tight adherence protein C
VVVAESDCGVSQRRALANLRRRVPAQELAAMSAVIERSRRYGSPLAEQLHDQASALRGAQRRRIEEDAARAAPKIQLAVALLLVPSVLLMIAAGLLANLDRFLAGI